MRWEEGEEVPYNVDHKPNCLVSYAREQVIYPLCTSVTSFVNSDNSFYLHNVRPTSAKLHKPFAKSLAYSNCSVNDSRRFFFYEGGSIQSSRKFQNSGFSPLSK